MADGTARRILLVDDEPDIRRSIKDLLEMQLPNTEVTTAASGAEALKFLSGVRPHLILTDFKMPGMNGLDFLGAASALHPDTPRIMMTAYPDLRIATQAINQAHIENFLAKPIDPDQLVEKIALLFQAEDTKHERERVLARTLRELQDALEAKEG